ncbi:hypothetical protein LCGC14_2901860, partial [marine sediment metagenome]
MAAAMTCSVCGADAVRAIAFADARCEKHDDGRSVTYDSRTR